MLLTMEGPASRHAGDLSRSKHGYRPTPSQQGRHLPHPSVAQGEMPTPS